MALTNHLIVFVKAPRLGAVKTRLARSVGAVAATAFYRETTATVLRRLAPDPRWRLCLAVTPDRAAAAGFWPADVARLAQGGGDLGRRMERMLRAPPPGPVVVVGSDIPELRAAHVARAFDALRDADAVFGPATDGGYWLVGMKRRPWLGGAFAGVRWSSRHALADTLTNLAGRRVRLVDRLDDIDTGADLTSWRRRASRVPAGGPSTRRNCTVASGNPTVT